MYIEWQRGGKSIDTKVKDIDPAQNMAMFNEKFQMKTVLEFDKAANLFLSKKSVLALFRKKDKKLLGRTDFDLSKYANMSKSSNDKLSLSDCEQPDAYIEIFIKAQPQSADAETPAGQQTSLKKQQTSFTEVAKEQEDFEKKKKALLSAIQKAQTELSAEQERSAQLNT